MSALSDVCERGAVAAAPQLLGAELRSETAVGVVTARIVEVEAYTQLGDAASHSHRGMTNRNQAMFGAPGTLYVYFSYGMHWCSNVVCGPPGVGDAVLLRAAAPLAGLDTMWARRSAARREGDLCSGPAKLCQAFEITGDDDGVDLSATAGRVSLRLSGHDVGPVAQGTRIGITKGGELPRRWWVKQDPNVSR